MCMSIHTSTTSRTHQKDARGGWCGSIGRPRGQKHAPHVNSSPPARGLGLLSAPLPKRCIVYACMFMCESDAAVAICGLGECSILQGSYPTVECGCNWAQGSSRAQIVCWMAWNWKARVVDRMPCTLLLMPYRAQTYILACWTLQKCLWNAVTLSAGSCHVCIVGPIPLSESVV